MPWLRQRAVDTFKKHNPDWQVWVVGTPEDIRSHGLSYAHEADWTWWRLLHLHGGFLVASDAISIAPIPDEYLDADLAAQTRGGNVYQFPILGAAKGNDLMGDASRWCKRMSRDELGYQSFGVDLLRRLTAGDISRYGKVFDIPEEAYCFYDWDQDPHSLWTVEGPEKELPDSALGIHWYGGHEKSKLMEPHSGPDGKSWLERWAFCQ